MHNRIAVAVLAPLIVLLAMGPVSAKADPGRLDRSQVMIRINQSLMLAGVQSGSEITARSALKSAAMGLFARHGLKHENLAALPRLGVVTARVGAGQDAALQALAADAGVLWVEHPRARAWDAPSDDPLYYLQWGLTNTADPQAKEELQKRALLPVNLKKGADIGGPEAWEVSLGSPDVVAAVLDTGIDASHPDLAANLWTNPGEVCGNGLDDDNNGYTDDCHGWHTYKNTGDVTDEMGHGTHVAGIVAAAANGVGVVGVAPGVKVMSVNAADLDQYDADDAAVIAGLEYILNQVYRGVNVKVVNMSLGAPGQSLTLRYALHRLGEMGVIVVVSQGNEASPTDFYVARYPVNEPLPNLISVAASAGDDSAAGFTNFGPYSADVFAPGAYVVSCIPAQKASQLSFTDGNAYWEAASGTSMAAPMVTGLVALAASIHPQADWRQLKDLVLSSAQKPSELATLARGGGRISAAAAARADIPSAPILYRFTDMLPSVGGEATVSGHNLGARPGSASVCGHEAGVVWWADNEVRLRLPAEALGCGYPAILNLTTADGRAAALPMYPTVAGNAQSLAVGHAGPYRYLAPHGLSMARVDDALYGIIRVGQDKGEETRLAWGKLLPGTLRLDYLGELPETMNDPGKAALAVLKGKIYLIGGGLDGQTHCYDPADGSWSPGPVQPVTGELSGHALTADENHLYLTGGLAKNGQTGLELVSDVHRWDPASNSWSVIAKWAASRLKSAAFASDGYLILLGGGQFSLLTTPHDAKYEMLNLATGEWLTGEFPFPASKGIIAGASGRLAYFGSMDRNGFASPFSASAAYEPGKPLQWSITPTRFDFTDLNGIMSWAYLEGGRMFLAGADYSGCPALPCQNALRVFGADLP